MVTKEDIERPLLREIEGLKNRAKQLQEENDSLYLRLQSLGEQNKEKQNYIDTYKQRYLDMEQSKNILVSELERLN